MRKYYFFGLFLLISFSCEKDNNIASDTFINKNSLIAYTWVSNVSPNDTIRFTDSVMYTLVPYFSNFETLTITHEYTYRLLPEDTIELIYLRPNKKYIPAPYHRKILYEREKAYLVIEDLRTVHPGYNGDTLFQKK